MKRWIEQFLSVEKSLLELKTKLIEIDVVTNGVERKTTTREKEIEKFVDIIRNKISARNKENESIFDTRTAIEKSISIPDDLLYNIASELFDYIFEGVCE